jgi:hypothetical protein
MVGSFFRTRSSSMWIVDCSVQLTAGHTPLPGTRTWLRQNLAVEWPHANHPEFTDASVRGERTRFERHPPRQCANREKALRSVGSKSSFGHPDRPPVRARALPPSKSRCRASLLVRSRPSGPNAPLSRTTRFCPSAFLHVTPTTRSVAPGRSPGLTDHQGSDPPPSSMSSSLRRRACPGISTTKGRARRSLSLLCTQTRMHGWGTPEGQRPHRPIGALGAFAGTVVLRPALAQSSPSCRR